jgi:hypothetical protein
MVGPRSERCNIPKHRIHLETESQQNFGEARLQTLLRAKQIENEDDDEYENDNFSAIPPTLTRLPERPG